MRLRFFLDLQQDADM
ncbi:hypothetical protein [Streptomyces sp. NPDC088816]